MIIKGLCGRYERWNPVHPTSGAFWGMGIGVGCGVGWGPGFGPEVIGYVGAGCGVGFSVGITLAGFGIGLPANYVFEVPYKAFMATSSAFEFARSSGLYEVGNIAGNSLSSVGPQIFDLQRKMSGRISNFKHKELFDKGIDFSGITNTISVQSHYLLDNLQKTRDRLFSPNKGPKE